MGNLYFKENYDVILKALGSDRFYIFGNTLYAHIFYLYCREKKVSQNVKAFIISDINHLVDNRKLHVIHGVPIKDIKWLSETEKECNIFFGAKEKTIQEQLLPVFKEKLDGNWYYTGDFIHNMMYCQYMSLPFHDMVCKYKVASNLYEPGTYMIFDDRYQNDYLYMPRVARGVLPDSRIFHNQENIDELHNKQLNEYVSIEKQCKKYKTKKKCRIYLAKSHFDKELAEDIVSPFSEVIQVGADLTDTDICSLKDNTGDNISSRNKDYCEMSAVYWAWKNDQDSDYIGLCHYRRRFDLDENTIKGVMEENYDAVYTVPQIIDGGLREEFVERNYFLTPEMWELTEEAIRRLSPEYQNLWKGLEETFFLISYNMFIMRRDIFEDFCSWVFNILEEVDRFYLNRGIQWDNRYLGYIAELLNTVYVMKNKDALKKGYVKMKKLESK